MTSNRKSPIWPYLIVLAGLFLLSVAAPRGWETRPSVRRATSSDAKAGQTPVTRPPDRAVVLHAKSHDTHDTPGRLRIAPLQIESPPKPGRASLFESDPSTASMLVEEGPTSDVPGPASEIQGPTPEDVGDEATAEVDPVQASEPQFSTDHTAELDSQETSAAEPSFVSIDNEPVGDNANGNLVPLDTGEAHEAEQPDYDHWPLPYALIERLEQLSRHDASHDWAADVRRLMDQLGEVRLDDPAATGHLRNLRAKAATDSPPGLSAAVEREFERAGLDLVRRLDLWERAAAAAAQQYVLHEAPSADTRMLGTVAEVVALIRSAPVRDTWREYLLLDRIDQLARDTSDDAADERHRTAQIVLARLTDPRLSPAQREVLTRPQLVDLRHRLRVWAVETIPVGRLLHTVEAYEQERVSSLGQILTEQSSVFAESPDAAERRLADELERHYRNANFRLVVTRELLERLLPQPPPAADRVNEMVVGVPTRGVSTTSTSLAVRLFPAEDQIRLGIEASGVVDSQTASTSGPVTLHSMGESSYFVGKLVVIDRQGLRVGRAMAEADNQSRLAGLETDFDGIPLVRNLVRSYALSEHEEKQPQARQEVEAKVSSRASERLDNEVNARLAQAEADFRRRILTPLSRLELRPKVVQLTTTGDRVTARLRLAGDDQAGAHTPRPLALSNSLASLQIHESALNNALDRLELAGRTSTLPELHQWITQRLDRPGIALPDDLPENVMVTFAASDPIRVRCADGRVEVTLAIAELDDGNRAWYDFQITAFYRPRLKGLRLEFFRDGPIELSGDAYAGRAAIGLRGIFAKVFSIRRMLKVEPAIKQQNAALTKLEFSSAFVDNGWISVTVADRGKQP